MKKTQIQSTTCTKIKKILQLTEKKRLRTDLITGTCRTQVQNFDQKLKPFFLAQKLYVQKEFPPIQQKIMEKNMEWKQLQEEEEGNLPKTCQQCQHKN